MTVRRTSIKDFTPEQIKHIVNRSRTDEPSTIATSMSTSAAVIRAIIDASIEAELAWLNEQEMKYGELERWKSISSDLEVSGYGRTYNKKSDMVSHLRQITYAGKSVIVSRLVFGAFIRKLKNTEDVIHKDGDILNNNYKNLEVVDVDQSKRNEAIVKYAIEHPEEKTSTIGAMFGVSRPTVSKVLKSAGVVRQTLTTSILTKEEENELVARAQAGEPAKELRAEYGITNNVYSVIMLKRGIRRLGRRLNDEDMFRIEFLFREGYTNLEIGEGLGISETVVSQFTAKLRKAR